MNKTIKKLPVVEAASSKKVPQQNKSNFTTAQIINHSATAQRQILLSHLEKHGSVTTPECRFNLDIPHPAGRINELRKRGYNIATVMVKDHNPGGTVHYFARYLLKSVNTDSMGAT